MRCAIRQSSGHGISTIIDALARKQMVNVCPVPKDLWCEIDIAADLAIAEELVGEMAIRQNCSHTPA